MEALHFMLVAGGGWILIVLVALGVLIAASRADDQTDLASPSPSSWVIARPLVAARPSPAAGTSPRAEPARVAVGALEASAPAFTRRA